MATKEYLAALGGDYLKNNKMFSGPEERYEGIDLSQQMNMYQQGPNDAPLESSMLDPLMFAGLGATANAVTKGVGSAYKGMQGLKTAPQGAIADAGRREATKQLGLGAAVAGSALNVGKMFGDDAVKAASRFSSKTLDKMKSVYNDKLLTQTRLAKESGRSFKPTQELSDEFANIVAYQRLSK